MSTEEVYQNNMTNTTISANKFYVYFHKKISDGVIFYVGKGSNRRAFSKSGRNAYWNNVVNKHGYEIEIFKNNLSENDAFELERLAIKTLKEIGVPLTNMTDGGEGSGGYKPSEELKLYISNKLKLLWKEKPEIFKSGKRKVSLVKKIEKRVWKLPVEIRSYDTFEIVVVNTTIEKFCNLNPEYPISCMKKTLKSNFSKKHNKANLHHCNGMYAILLRDK